MEEVGVHLTEVAEMVFCFLLYFELLQLVVSRGCAAPVESAFVCESAVLFVGVSGGLSSFPLL